MSCTLFGDVRRCSGKSGLSKARHRPCLFSWAVPRAGDLTEQSPCHSGTSPSGPAFGRPKDKLREEPGTRGLASSASLMRDTRSWLPGSPFGRPGMTVLWRPASSNAGRLGSPDLPTSGFRRQIEHDDGPSPDAPPQAVDMARSDAESALIMERLQAHP